MRAGIGGFILLMQAGLLPAVELPEAAGVIDVTGPPYNADNTGQRDATAALLQAMHEAGRRTPGIFTTTDRAVQIVYLPKGIFRISDTLCFETAEIRAARPPRRFLREGEWVVVEEVVDRWRQVEGQPEWPRADYFKVRGADRCEYLLKHDFESDAWCLGRRWKRAPVQR